MSLHLSVSHSVHRGVSVPACTMGHMTGGLCPGGVSVQGESLSRGSLCPGGSLSEGLCLGVSVWGSLSGGSLSRGSLCRGVSIQGVSVEGVSVQRDLCPGGVSVRGVLCPGESLLERHPHYSNERVIHILLESFFVIIQR